MFDFSKLGDMSKLASEAKQLQSEQKAYQEQQMELLNKISSQLDEIIKILKKNH